jgi:hypothetical protein
METAFITIKITYDPEKFPKDDMHWAIDKLTDCDEIGNIGYDWDSWTKTTEVTYHDE